jgi:hypothetical protein
VPLAEELPVLRHALPVAGPDQHRESLIDNVTVEQLFDAQAWPSLCAIVEFAPHDDVLPVRADYGVGSR